MSKQADCTKIRHGIALAATLAIAVTATAALPEAAAAFGFRGGMGGGFRGGPHLSQGHAGGFRQAIPRQGHGGLVKSRPDIHLASGRVPGGNDPRRPWPRRPHDCHGFRCGPIFVPPLLIATVGTAAIGYYYGDQPIYYRGKLVRAAPTCEGPTGTFALISFVPSATAADIAAFLQTYKTAISDGPNEDAVYVIKLADRRMSEEEVRDELTAMQAQTSVVRLVSQQDASAAR